MDCAMNYGGIYVVYGLTDPNGRFKHYLRCDSAIELYPFFSFSISNAGLKTAQALLFVCAVVGTFPCFHPLFTSLSSLEINFPSLF